MAETTWGAIYCRTHWGDRKNIQYSLPYKPDCFLLEDTQEYTDRVTTDGGVIEAKRCLDDKLFQLGAPGTGANTYGANLLTGVNANFGADANEGDFNSLYSQWQITAITSLTVSSNVITMNAGGVGNGLRNLSILPASENTFYIGLRVTAITGNWGFQVYTTSHQTMMVLDSVGFHQTVFTDPSGSIGAVYIRCLDASGSITIDCTNEDVELRQQQ